MRIVTGVLAGLAALAGAASPASAEVQLVLRGGRVTLVAKDATARQILAEWERVGQTKAVNAERIPGGPLNIELTDVPEQQALDVVLRLATGVVYAPRVDPAPGNLSVFERIIVMPPSTAPLPPASSSSGSAPAPFSPPNFPNPNDDDDRATQVPRNNPPTLVFPNAPAFNQPPQGGLAQPAAAPPGVPTAATGVSVPGMMVPVPTPPQGPPVPPGQNNPPIFPRPANPNP